MSKVQTNGTQNDNTNHEAKINLRKEAIDSFPKSRKTINVLDVFSGNFRQWGELKKYRAGLSITRIDKRKGLKGVYICADSMKALASLDINKYDIIDIDAYGSPLPELLYIMQNKKKESHPVIILTWINVRGMVCDKALLKLWGITDGMLAHKPAFTMPLIDLIVNALSTLGIKKVRFIRGLTRFKNSNTVIKQTQKYYLWFQS